MVALSTIGDVEGVEVDKPPSMSVTESAAVGTVVDGLSQGDGYW